MTAVSTLIVLAGVGALVDWVAVGTSNNRLQYAAKPAVLALLVAAAALIPATHSDLGARRGWFVVALLCCLTGDVLLMLPQNLFIPGLVAFLAGHGFFIVGLLQPAATPTSPPFAFSATGLTLSVVVVLAVECLPGYAIVRSLHRHGQSSLVGPGLPLYGGHPDDGGAGRQRGTTSSGIWGGVLLGVGHPAGH